MRILTIVPCYNAGRHIGGVVKAIKKYNKDILVVDDGSTDKSYGVIKKIRGISVIRHKKNRGKGAALKTGFGYALKKGYDAVITIDADGQHDPKEIANFIKNSKHFDIIVGSRMKEPRKMPRRRQLANKVSSFLLTKICKQRITDSQSGYRLIKKDVLKNIKLDEDRYMAETELLIKAAKNYKIGEIPIKAIYGDEVSYINQLLTIPMFMRLILKTIFSR